jgi:chloramphenicol O-acetyltransferase
LNSKSYSFRRGKEKFLKSELDVSTMLAESYEKRFRLIILPLAISILALVFSGFMKIPTLYGEEQYSFITKWGDIGSEDGQFVQPFGVAVDSSGNNVYVADSRNNRIQKFDSNGTFITKWGNTGSEDGQFVFPLGVAVDSSGNNVYVADTSNNRIQVFSSATPSTSSSSTYTNSRLN